MICPCCSQLEYSNCCEPYILGTLPAPSPEALMRSRYTAYVKINEPYLRDTLAPESRHDYNAKEVREWAQRSEWLGLEVLNAEGDTVEFNAKYKIQGKVLNHHEVSKFKKINNKWYFVDGESQTREDGDTNNGAAEVKTPLVRSEPKIGRNDPCTCGSAKKYKKCCGA